MKRSKSSKKRLELIVMPRKPTKPDDPEQSKRFIETAEEVGADDEQALERAFGKIKSEPPKRRENAK
jgi:hypothetical protein